CCGRRRLARCGRHRDVDDREIRQGLANAVLKDCEILLREAPDRLTPLVEDARIDLDVVDLRSKLRRRALLRSRHADSAGYRGRRENGLTGPHRRPLESGSFETCAPTDPGAGGRRRSVCTDPGDNPSAQSASAFAAHPAITRPAANW